MDYNKTLASKIVMESFEEKKEVLHDIYINAAKEYGYMFIVTLGMDFVELQEPYRKECAELALEKASAVSKYAKTLVHLLKMTGYEASGYQFDSDTNMFPDVVYALVYYAVSDGETASFDDADETAEKVEAMQKPWIKEWMEEIFGNISDETSNSDEIRRLDVQLRRGDRVRRKEDGSIGTIEFIHDGRVTVYFVEGPLRNQSKTVIKDAILDIDDGIYELIRSSEDNNHREPDKTNKDTGIQNAVCFDDHMYTDSNECENKEKSVTCWEQFIDYLKDCSIPYEVISDGIFLRIPTPIRFEPKTGIEEFIFDDNGYTAVLPTGESLSELFKCEVMEYLLRANNESERAHFELSNKNEIVVTSRYDTWHHNLDREQFSNSLVENQDFFDDYYDGILAIGAGLSDVESELKLVNTRKDL